MDSRNGLINFALFILLFVFSFVFCLFALTQPASVLFGVLALFGFIFGIAGSIFNGALARVEGSVLATWFFVYAGVVAIILVWYLTRCGTAFGWW
ncbi:MAG: hypothetical protein A2087_14630 [Spirochaetes bacterium GWD1_61_31]|nr:MAG: hypothetical protein A2Y37_09300 [Spirochaetes bacterium GWB1_60_80]OHD31613.1 MAG: hypothetical protein A2004_09515 [Spirochaetes bacterium GWC1_61_12]OHD35011.1 MAG: hypothetical protein A2087_14630 [Spirochaetes bacterium GWD1_61_31]OHD44041.1 MAG: hypothetical protein A2Y35_01750 [Spirochaetes bacterium GWE1_60_18]OHD59076.1 MAG: hypothetical protein A2Y32_02470 [Spirochaetes bacterium GWF1_60_12]HAP42607.1 hypothetical protein [Spirochaetaceae bacterium]